MENTLNDGRFWDGAVLPLLKFCESLYTGNCAFRQVLNEIAGHDWESPWMEARQAEAATGDAHAKFENLYASLSDPARFHEAVQEFLRIKTVV